MKFEALFGDKFVIESNKKGEERRSKYVEADQKEKDRMLQIVAQNEFQGLTLVRPQSVWYVKKVMGATYTVSVHWKPTET